MVPQTYLDNVNMLNLLNCRIFTILKLLVRAELKLQLLLFWSRCKLLLSPSLFPPLPPFLNRGCLLWLKLDMLDWYSHVFSVENKTSTCFRGNNNEILLKCVLISFNKITSSKGLTFFFEIWGFNQGPLVSLVSQVGGNLQELKLPFCVWKTKIFLQQRPYMTVQGWRWHELQNAERKAWISLWRYDWIGFWSQSGWWVCPHISEARTQITTDHPSRPSLVTTCTFLSSGHSFFFFPKSVCPSIMVLFSSLIKCGFLCCVVHSSRHMDLVQLSPLTSALSVTEGTRISVASQVLFDPLCNAVLERDEWWVGWDQRWLEWRVMKGDTVWIVLVCAFQKLCNWAKKHF